MEDKLFFEHYRIRANSDELPHEVSRTGAAINYEAIDVHSGAPVTLQLVPLASIDPARLEQFQERARSAEKLDHLNIARLLAVGVEDEYLALVSEHVEGETADSWIVAHGPLSADAVLRIGIQVVRALAAAAFFSLTHRAIQPSNIMIVPGRMDDGGWPFVKLLNFGLAGLESHSDSVAARELAPSIAPQFASPEQLQNRPLDFRSEVYSLGATMCFLLTGAVPLVLAGKKARFRARRLSELHRAPKALRNLLGYMLRENPEERPQDPVVFEQEIRKCLTKVERRHAIRRKLGIPMAAVISRPAPKESTPVATPGMQILGGVLMFVALLLMGVAVASFLLPKGTLPFFHLSRGPDKIGVPIGVSDAVATASKTSAPVVASTASAANQPAPAANQFSTNPSPAPIASDASSPAQIASATRESQPEPSSTQPEANPSSAPVASDASSPAQIASTTLEAKPEPPAEGLDASSATQQEPTSKQASENAASDSDSSSRSNAKNIASNSKRRSTSQRAREADSSPNEFDRGTAGRFRSGSIHARFLGKTADGRRILRLPSGRVVVVTPGAPDEELYAPRRQYMNERPEIFVPRPQPFYPPGYTPSD
jgi:serine/threonine protein kinase